MSDLAPATKRCTECGEDKNLSEFHRARKNADGLRYNCKSCTVAATKAWQAKKRAEMGDEAWLASRRVVVAKTRSKPEGREAERRRHAIRNAAIAMLIERHRTEYEHLLLLAKRGEL